MNTYRDFSQFYDALTFNVSYQSRADYILDILKRKGAEAGLTLDLACGTGSLTCELKKRGVDVYGIDGSADMLSVAMNKASEMELDILFLRQNMTSLDLYGTIDTCVCTLDSINHLNDEKDVSAAFSRVSLFMNPGGRFIFDVNTIYKHNSILGDNTFVYDTGDAFCVWQNSLKENNIVNMELDIFEREKNVYRRYTERISERAYSLDMLSDMLEKAGFYVEDIFADMSFDRVQDTTDRAVFVAVKR